MPNKKQIGAGGETVVSHGSFRFRVRRVAVAKRDAALLSPFELERLDGRQRGRRYRLYRHRRRAGHLVAVPEVPGGADPCAWLAFSETSRGLRASR